MICSKCEVNQDEVNFSYKYKSLGIRKKVCKVCDKTYRKDYYENNKTKALSYSFKSTKEIRQRNSQFVWNYLKEHPCVKCNESDPIVLEFDHRDNSNKEFEISRMVSNSNGLQKIKEEIEKCDVLCANCHRRKTAKQFNWYKYIDKN